MKIFFFISFFFLLYSCTNNKTVYWCGDHACINKKEKEAYFKKTMIVEIRELSKKDIKESLSNIKKNEWSYRIIFCTKKANRLIQKPKK